ncbi:hypothetical protein PVL29_001143 [Vitis rotundifolia]|uniref:Glucosamine inositolphosphorylceramide transferase 1 N-terminal domain-containing protein n=1 Tax=Vitis rotundifolia TaxID=103349 RepID=A0AA39ECT8_VITRO|nr:hypothetical protein PVL29_001143 [Vitis rotundifolia]
MGDHYCFLSSTFVFFFAYFVVYGFIAAVYAWLFVNPHAPLELASLGCRPDSERSWAIGVFYGDSPFYLRPIEAMNVWRNESAAWPVANPVVTCASASDAVFPSNFVVDHFLYVQGDTFFLFYETKNSITMQGDIGVSKSDDKGANRMERTGHVIADAAEDDAEDTDRAVLAAHKAFNEGPWRTTHHAARRMEVR